MDARTSEQLWEREVPAAAGALPALDPVQLFAPLEGAKGVLLAVSGGPDSMALMRLAADWAKTEAGALVPLAVATVDHGLRPQSHAEAEQVGRWAQALGLPHHRLAWEGSKPATRLQERARTARYDLLFDCAGSIGADHVATAHHADDQAETILFRLLRGSGLAGLSGMPAQVRHRAGVTLLRPLLGIAKADLVAFCAARGQAYFDDPSNDDPRFARARLRKLMPILAQEGLDRDALLRLGRRAARADSALAQETEKYRERLSAIRGPTSFSASFAALADAPAEIFLRVIAAEIEALCPPHPLRLERLERLAAALQAALKNKMRWRATLAGLAVSLDARGGLTIVPERPRRRGRPSTENSPSPEPDPGRRRIPVTSP